MRYRIRWAKRGKIRFISAHDVAGVFERAVRRGGIPIAYSQGFSPHPKISFGTALPVGYGSEVELLDMDLTDAVGPLQLAEALDAASPEGIAIVGVAELPAGEPSLGSLLVAADYDIRVEHDDLAGALDAFLACDSFEIRRKLKGTLRTDDLRPGVIGARVATGGIWMRCALTPRATRPSDVLGAMGSLVDTEFTTATFHRTALLARAGEELVELDERPLAREVFA